MNYTSAAYLALATAEPTSPPAATGRIPSGGYQAGGRGGAGLRTPREVEREVLARAIRTLTRIRETRRSNPADWTKTIWDNRHMWTHFAAAAADPGSRLPEAVRADILSLARHVEKRTDALLANGSLTTLEELIEINRAVWQGLGSAPATAATG